MITHEQFESRIACFVQLHGASQTCHSQGLNYIPGHKRLASVCGWKAPPVCSGQCAGLTYIQPTASSCWDRTPESPLSTAEKGKILESCNTMRGNKIIFVIQSTIVENVKLKLKYAAQKKAKRKVHVYLHDDLPPQNCLKYLFKYAHWAEWPHTGSHDSHHPPSSVLSVQRLQLQLPGAAMLLTLKGTTNNPHVSWQQ